MKKHLLVAAISLTIIPAVLSANTTVRVNGASDVSVTSWSFNSNVLSVTTSDTSLRLLVPGEDGGNPTNPDPVDPGPVDPDPVDPTPPSECGSVPSNVQMQATWNLANQGGQITQALQNSTTIYSTPIVTTSNPAYAGRFEYAPMTGSESTSREVWISPCPGGTWSAAPAACRSTLKSSVMPRVNWAQSASGVGCYIEPSRTYYLNIKNVNCSGTCGIYRIMYSNGNP